MFNSSSTDIHSTPECLCISSPNSSPRLDLISAEDIIRLFLIRKLISSALFVLFSVLHNCSFDFVLSVLNVSYIAHCTYSPSVYTTTVLYSSFILIYYNTSHFRVVNTKYSICELIFESFMKIIVFIYLLIFCILIKFNTVFEFSFQCFHFISLYFIIIEFKFILIKFVYIVAACTIINENFTHTRGAEKFRTSYVFESFRHLEFIFR